MNRFHGRCLSIGWPLDFRRGNAGFSSKKSIANRMEGQPAPGAPEPVPRAGCTPLRALDTPVRLVHNFISVTGHSRLVISNDNPGTSIRNRRRLKIWISVPIPMKYAREMGWFATQDGVSLLRLRERDEQLVKASAAKRRVMFCNFFNFFITTLQDKPELTLSLLSDQRGVRDLPNYF